MRARLVIVIAALLALLEIVASFAWAQTPGGAFERLAPGDQRIARSLYDAQRDDSPRGARRLTLEEIAVRKGDHGWNTVFKEMKSQGLVNARSLDQVVDRTHGGPRRGK